MNVLSLFDGMSCGQIALNRIGIKYDKYYASEIDEYAIKVTKHNFPNTHHLGDIRKINISKLQKIDLLIGGSPCQNLSFAGEMKGMTTKDNIEILSLDHYTKLKNEGFEFQGQSYLFWEYVKLLRELKPKYFLLENVKMLKKWENVFSDVLGIKPIEINSSLVSAQNRRRLYWTNIPNILQLEDKGIKLKDIITDGCIDTRMTTNDKAYALTATYNGAAAWNSIERKQRTMILCSINDKKVNIDSFNEAPFSFCESRTNVGEEIRRKIMGETNKDSYHKSKEFKMYVPNEKENSLSLVTVESPLDFIVDPSWKYRKLHTIEMERLQTVPEGYTSIVSDYQARKMLGNGWTVDVISHILKGLLEEFK